MLIACPMCGTKSNHSQNIIGLCKNIVTCFSNNSFIEQDYKCIYILAKINNILINEGFPYRLLIKNSLQ